MDGLPPYPGYTIAPPAVTPYPSQVNKSASDREAAYFLVKCYRSAYLARYGELCWSLSWLDGVNGEISKFSHYHRLVEASKLLQEKGIAPSAWCAFSIDTWMHYGPKSQQRDEKHRAPVSWVFDPKRIDKRSGWFSSESGRYAGGQTIFGPLLKKLLHRYSEMRMQLRPGMSVEQRRALATRYFPGDSYERLLEAARQESHDVEQELQRKVERGVFIW